MKLEGVGVGVGVGVRVGVGVGGRGDEYGMGDGGSYRLRSSGLDSAW